jgi:hypothetical protein
MRAVRREEERAESLTVQVHDLSPAWQREIEEYALDFYRRFCSTGNSDEWGRKTWKLLHTLARNYPCPPCRPDFTLYVDGIHDLTNIKLDKNVYDVARFTEFVDLVSKATAKAFPEQFNHARVRMRHRSSIEDGEVEEEEEEEPGEDETKEVAHYIVEEQEFGKE